MAFSEIEHKRHEKAVEKYLDSCRPPVEIRNEPSEKIESSVAKAKYYKSRDEWKVYWMKSDLKWHSYEPVPEVKTLEVFFEVLEADAYGCFWG